MSSHSFLPALASPKDARTPKLLHDPVGLLGSFKDRLPLCELTTLTVKTAVPKRVSIEQPNIERDHPSAPSTPRRSFGQLSFRDVKQMSDKLVVLIVCVAIIFLTIFFCILMYHINPADEWPQCTERQRLMRERNNQIVRCVASEKTTNQ